MSCVFCISCFEHHAQAAESCLKKCVLVPQFQCIRFFMVIFIFGFFYYLIFIMFNFVKSALTSLWIAITNGEQKILTVVLLRHSFVSSFLWKKLFELPFPVPNFQDIGDCKISRFVCCNRAKLFVLLIIRFVTYNMLIPTEHVRNHKRAHEIFVCKYRKLSLWKVHPMRVIDQIIPTKYNTLLASKDNSRS